MPDPVYSFYQDGNISLTNGSDIAIGQFTAWDVALLPFDFIVPNGGANGLTLVRTKISATQIQLGAPWSGPTLVRVPYFAVRWTNYTDLRNLGPQIVSYLAKLQGIPDDVVAALNTAIATVNAAVTAAAGSARDAATSATAVAAAVPVATGASTTATGAAATATSAAASATSAAALVQALLGIAGDYGDQETTGSSLQGDFGDQT